MRHLIPEVDRCPYVLFPMSLFVEARVHKPHGRGTDICEAARREVILTCEPAELRIDQMQVRRNEPSERRRARRGIVISWHRGKILMRNISVAWLFLASGKARAILEARACLSLQQMLGQWKLQEELARWRPLRPPCAEDWSRVSRDPGLGDLGDSRLPLYNCV